MVSWHYYGALLVGSQNVVIEQEVTYQMSFLTRLMG
jgi:hypothetical protein